MNLIQSDYLKCNHHWPTVIMGVGNIVTNVLMKVPSFLLLKKSALVFKAMRVLSACFDFFNVKKKSPLIYYLCHSIFLKEFQKKLYLDLILFVELKL